MTHRFCLLAGIRISGPPIEHPRREVRLMGRVAL